MTRLLMLTFLTKFVHALLAHCCGEVIQMVLNHLAPGLGQLTSVAIALVFGVTVVELAASLWDRYGN
jgi:hypothetical protein